MLIREARPDEHARLGEITVDAYTSLDGYVPEPEYVTELGDVAGRSKHAIVLAAVDDDGTLLGGVTYVDDLTSPLAEHDIASAASIRMLAVDPQAQGRGAGEALTGACLDRARAAGRTEVVLHSTPWMTTAHRLYERLGFERDESLDWTPVPGLTLLFFRRRLDGT